MPKLIASFFLLFLCFSLVGCHPPSHLIRINESLPKNATIEKESVVVYAQTNCPGDCPLSDKDVKWHSATIYKNVRQIQFTRYGRMTCDPDELWEGYRGYNYYVIWYREGVAHRGIQAYCDAEKKEFVVKNILDKTTHVTFLKSRDEWVVEVK